MHHYGRLSNSAGDKDGGRIAEAAIRLVGGNGKRCGTKDGDSVREGLGEVEDYQMLANNTMNSNCLQDLLAPS
jgi:hypothetical protein